MNPVALKFFPATRATSIFGAPRTCQPLTAFSPDLPAGIVGSGKPPCQAMKTFGGQKSWKRLERPALPPQHWMRMARKSIPTFRSTCPARHGAQPRPTVSITSADAATLLVLPGCCFLCGGRQADIYMHPQTLVCNMIMVCARFRAGISILSTPVSSIKRTGATPSRIPWTCTITAAAKSSKPISFAREPARSTDPPLHRIFTVVF